ncbi:MAG: outer membrane protein transport protein [Leptospiraceae bacterium]|nr:outer membrane protein transport protein [Leptospiraceae bacterium]
MKNNRVVNIWFLLTIFFLIVNSNLNAGDYGDVYGAHPAANAMGNAVVSTVSDSSSVFYNVAGLGRMSYGDKYFAAKEKKALEEENPDLVEPVEEETMEPGIKGIWQKVKKNSFTNLPVYRPVRTAHELTLQYHFGRPSLNTSAPFNQDIARVRDDYAALGLTLNLNSIYDLKRNFKFGLNAIVPGTGQLLTVNDVNPTVHRYLQHGVSNSKPTIMGGVGLELWKDRLFAGVGFTALAGGSGSILLKDVPISPDRVTPNQQVILQVKPFINPIYGLAFNWGKFNLGVSYRRETALAINDLPARAQTTLLGIQLDFDVSLFDNFTPRKWAYGIGYKPLDNLTFTFEANRELWSAFRQSRTKATYSERIYFNDITYYRGGAEYAWKEWIKFRAGMARKPTPIPSADMARSQNWMDFDRYILTGGLSLALLPGQFSFLSNQKSPIIFDFVVEYQKLHGKHVYKYNPSLQNPPFSMGGRVLHFGFSVTVYL